MTHVTKGARQTGVFGFVISQFMRAKPNLVIMVVNYGRNNGSPEGGVPFSQGFSRRFSGFAGVTGGCVKQRRKCAQVRGLHLHGDARAHIQRERKTERERDLNKRKNQSDI